MAKCNQWPSEKSGQVQKRWIFISMVMWINGQTQSVAKWKKMAKCKNDEIFILMANWINGQMHSVAKCKNGEIRQIAKWINGQMQWVPKCKNDRICDILYVLKVIKWLNGRMKKWPSGVVKRIRQKLAVSKKPIRKSSQVQNLAKCQTKSTSGAQVAKCRLWSRGKSRQVPDQVS